MLSLQYQNLYDVNKTSSGLNTYCKLEGLDTAYIRSTEKAGRRCLKSGILVVFGSLFNKRSMSEKGKEYKEATCAQPNMLL